jgi:hypothetical protein
MFPKSKATAPPVAAAKTATAILQFGHLAELVKEIVVAVDERTVNETGPMI